MKNTYSLILLILIPVLVFSQGSSSSAIDIVGSFGYTNVDIRTNYTASLESPKRYGKWKPNFGINYNQKLAEQIWLKVGIHFSTYAYEGEKEEDWLWGLQHDGTGGWILNPASPHLQPFYKYQFVELPMAIRYEFNNKKLSPFIEVGLVPGIKTNATRIKHLSEIESKSTDLESVKVVPFFFRCFCWCQIYCYRKTSFNDTADFPISIKEIV